MFSQYLNVDELLSFKTCLDPQIGKCSENIVIADKDLTITSRCDPPSYGKNAVVNLFRYIMVRSSYMILHTAC